MSGTPSSRPYRLDSERTRQNGHRHHVERKRSRSFSDEKSAIEAARADIEAGWCPTVSMPTDTGRAIIFDWLEEL